MNWEQQLELQAWVDGELSESAARRVAAMVQTNARARTLAEELKMARAFISANEPVVAVPESRDFYWSQIRRRIESAEKVREPAAGFSWSLLWRRLATPLTGLALVVFLGVISFNSFRSPVIDDGSRFMVEVENLSEDVGSISYRSQSENMFVVYLYKKDQDTESATAAGSSDDTFFQ